MIPDVPISPTDLRDYAKARGWQLQKVGAYDRLYVMTHPAWDRRQLVFPMDTSAPDFREAAMLAVTKLAELSGQSIQAVLNSVLEAGDDAIVFRVIMSRQDDPYVPLSFAGSMVSGAQQLFLSSACTVLKPQAHHPRLGRAEAQQILDAARFRHTQRGSFVLNVSCPVQALDVQAPLLPDEVNAPFVRRATYILRRALGSLVNAIETDALDSFVNEIKTSKVPLLSSNFCEALTRFEEESLKNSVEIGISWASSIPRPDNEPAVTVIRIQHDYFSRIEEVRRELRSTLLDTEGFFVGTVEKLEGEMGQDGKRSGDVILSLLQPEGEQVRARVTLTADQYAKADLAHMNDGKFVRIEGRLHPGRQPRQLSDVKRFDLIQRE